MICACLAEPADAASILGIYAPFVEHTFTTFETAVPSVQEMAARIAAVQQRHAWLVARTGTEVMGYAYAAPHRQRAAYQWVCEFSVYLAPAAQGKGVGSALYTCLKQLMIHQGYCQALAGVVLPNPRSLRFHQACGFASFATYVNVGFKLGAWRSVEWLRMELGSNPVPPPLPRSWRELPWELVQTTLDAHGVHERWEQGRVGPATIPRI